jgi:23S rRNA-/tRNA-specific pseudouridylate synthase
MNQSKIRLHKYLINWLKEQGLDSYTNPEIKRNIETYGVLFNGTVIKNQLQWITPSVDEVGLKDWPVRDKVNFDQIKILFETKDFVLLSKPVGMPVESGAGYLSQNLLTWLNSCGLESFDRALTWDSKSKYIKTKDEFFLAHRLDKDTQGIIMVAKSKDVLEFLQSQFKSRDVTKKYLAIVDGVVDQNYIINNWQSRDRVNPIKQKFFYTQSEAMNYDPESRYAKSIIQPQIICLESNQTLIQVEIKTGRMHQIRVQCENLGFALSCDKVYNTKVEFDLQTFRSNDDNKMFLPLKEIGTLNEKEFEALKTKIFGETKYCLLSNELEIMLPDERLAKFVVFDNFDK